MEVVTVDERNFSVKNPSDPAAATVMSQIIFILKDPMFTLLTYTRAELSVSMAMRPQAL